MGARADMHAGLRPRPCCRHRVAARTRCEYSDRIQYAAQFPGAMTWWGALPSSRAACLPQGRRKPSCPPRVGPVEVGPAGLEDRPTSGPSVRRQDTRCRPRPAARRCAGVSSARRRCHVRRRLAPLEPAARAGRTSQVSQSRARPAGVAAASRRSHRATAACATATSAVAQTGACYMPHTWMPKLPRVSRWWNTLSSQRLSGSRSKTTRWPASAAQRSM